MAMTGMPNVRRDSSFRRLETPEPGEMPLSQICTVVPTRSGSPAARASMAMRAAGFVSRTRAAKISQVSMPVCPRTPGASTETGRKERMPSAAAVSSPTWRVAKICRAAAGPRASGVIEALPNPATNTAPSGRSRERASDNASTSSSKCSGALRKGAQMSVK